MRRPAGPRKPRRSRPFSFLAPVAGWIKNQNLARPVPGSPQGAERLVNIFPTATGAEMRGGSARYATLGDGDQDVRSFLRYKNGATERFFAAIDGGIYDITVIADPEVSPDPVVIETISGDWSSIQFAATGGVYLVAVNGADDMRFYDGTYWYPINSQPLSILYFDGQTVNFTVGETVTGGTSGAHAVIIAVQDNGSSGALILGTIAGGTFQNNEALSDGAGGSATADGVSTVLFNGVTGIETNELAYVWTYKSRLFFIQKNSMNAWYAGIDQLGGALTKFPMGGIFPLGGSLLFGAVWSTESGADGGLSAQCVFVTTEGEVAVYGGIDPADWSLVGVYRIGKPLGPDAWHRAGGDIVINTDIGHVPLSLAINRDIASLSVSSVSYPIETAWNEAVALRRFASWHCAVWPERQMVLIALPTGDGQVPTMYAANTGTGRWGEFTGWDGKCLATFQGRMFFGSGDGKVVEAYVTGLDQGLTYTAVYVPLFDDLGEPASLKTPNLARPVVRSNSPVTVTVSMQYDFAIDLPPPPSAQIVNTGSIWGIAEWGLDTWGGDTQKTTQQDWQSVGGAGYAFAPAIQFTSGSLVPLATEIIRIDVTFDMGDILS